MISSLSSVFRLSNNDKRHKAYTEFLQLCESTQVTVKDIVKLGAQLMSKQKLHHHFFGDYSWKATAQSLTNYALKNLKNNQDYITPEECVSIFSLFEKRIVERVPVEYITNEAQYCGRPFYVNDQVLVPRSIMSARFQDFLKDTHWDSYRVLDLCTGSGCIGITLALMNPHIQVDLVDISSEALKVAQINIEKHGLQERVRCIQSDCFENVEHQYDLMITNPPYVSVNEYNKTPEEFKKEPKIALESGIDGLDIVHVILSQADHYLTTKGALIAEVGSPAAKRLKKHYPNIAFKWFKYKRPNGTVSWFSTPGVFLCQKEDLQSL